MINWRAKGFGFNPVLFCNDVADFKKEYRGWYFWDEIWANLYGPFHSRMEAWTQLLDYCEELNIE